jgi:multidrug efflux pump subunit AcrA (membrane-fusion protein)
MLCLYQIALFWQTVSSNYVFLYQNGKAKKQQVTVGSRTSESAEIKSGVSALGDAVIVAGAGFLEDNDVVALSK